MQNGSEIQAEPPWRPRLAFFALVLGLLACATTLVMPALEELDRKFHERSLVHIEKPVTVLGVESTLKYVKAQRRGWTEQPFLVATIVLMLAGTAASALSMRSLVAGRPTWRGAVGMLAGAGAIGLTLYFNPMGWIMFFLFIPGFASVLLGAALVGIERGAAIEGSVNFDHGGSAGGADW